MKILKILLWCLLGCLLIPLLLILFLTIMAQKEYAPPLQQSQKEIVQIELLDTHTFERIPLYTLEESEIPGFLLQLDSMVFRRYVNTPQTHDGILAVKITYRNGYCDILGTDSNSYCTPDGDEITHDAFYYLKNEKAFIELFSQYIDPSLLPEEMVGSLSTKE